MEAILGMLVDRRLKRDAIADLTAIGWGRDEIARVLGVSPKTVKRQRSRLRTLRQRIKRMKAAREDLDGRLDLDGGLDDDDRP